MRIAKLLSKSQLAVLQWRCYALSAVVIVLDQVSKIWIVNRYQLYEQEAFTAFFQLTLRHNYGAAFSFLADHSGWQRWFLGFVALLASIVIAFWITRVRQRHWCEAFGLALILGGAVGNLIDRAAYGYVVDFLLVHYKDYMWQAFNVADSAICAGAALVMYDAFFVKDKPASDDGAQEA